MSARETRSCGTCKHLLKREWQLTHGTCEWVDSGAAMPRWVKDAWPTVRLDDASECKTWEPK